MNLLTVSGILIALLIFLVIFKIYLRNVTRVILYNLKTMNELPDNIYRKTGNFSLENYQKEDDLKTFSFAFNYVFINTIDSIYNPIRKIFNEKEYLDIVIKILSITRFGDKLNIFLKNTFSQCKKFEELHYVLGVIKTHKYYTILNHFIDKKLIDEVMGKEYSIEV